MIGKRDARTSWNILKDRIFVGVLVFLASLTGLPLVVILFNLFAKGVSSLSWDMLTRLPNPPGEPGGGIGHAIVGSLLIVGIASLLAIPLGILVGIYLSENKKSKMADMARILVDVLQGVPSIVIGIIAYVWVVMTTGGFSGFSGGIALAIMMLPVVIKNTEETLKLIPDTIKEAAYALGVPYNRVVLRVILPCGLSGIVTGILVAIARVLGETAPLLFTAFGSPFMVLDPSKPMETVPHIIFKYATSPYDDWQAIAWGASFLLVMFVLVLNLIAKVVVSKWKVKF